MADVTIKYKDNTIVEMDSKDTKTLTTGGCYCEADIVVDYTPKVDDSFRHWDVTVTGEREGAFCYVLQDEWLKTHRADSNLCVAIIPITPIRYNGTTAQQGIYLATNDIMVIGKDNDFKSLSYYMMADGSTMARLRQFGLTNPDNVGDVGIATDGRLYVVSTGSYPLAPGEYCITAWLK